MQTLYASTAMMLQAVGIIALLLVIPWLIGYRMKRERDEEPLSAQTTGVQLYHSRRRFPPLYGGILQMNMRRLISRLLPPGKARRDS